MTLVLVVVGLGNLCRLWQVPWDLAGRGSCVSPCLLSILRMLPSFWLLQRYLHFFVGFLFIQYIFLDSLITSHHHHAEFFFGVFSSRTFFWLPFFFCLRRTSPPFFSFFFFSFFFSMSVTTFFRCNRLDGCISRNRIFTDSLTGL